MKQFRKTSTILVMIALAMIGGTSASLGGAAFILVGGIIGALWGLGLAALAEKITRNEARHRKWSNGVLFLTAICATLVAGASLMAQLLSSTALQSQPQFFADMVRGSIGVAEALPFYVLNTPLEWFLIPMSLLLNWNNTFRRRLLIATLAVWTLHRSWTYLYFVPQITDLSKSTGLLTSNQLEVARNWVNLSWIRHIFDDITAVLVLLAGFANSNKNK